MTQMKAVRIAKADDKITAELRDESLPIPGPRDVLIKVHTASLNYRDTALLRDEYRAPTQEHGITFLTVLERLLQSGQMSRGSQRATASQSAALQIGLLVHTPRNIVQVVLVSLSTGCWLNM